MKPYFLKNILPNTLKLDDHQITVKTNSTPYIIIEKLD